MGTRSDFLAGNSEVMAIALTQASKHGPTLADTESIPCLTPGILESSLCWHWLISPSSHPMAQAHVCRHTRTHTQ